MHVMSIRFKCDEEKSVVDELIDSMICVSAKDKYIIFFRKYMKSRGIVTVDSAVHHILRIAEVNNNQKETIVCLVMMLRASVVDEYMKIIEKYSIHLVNIIENNMQDVELVKVVLEIFNSFTEKKTNICCRLDFFVAILRKYKANLKICFLVNNLLSDMMYKNTVDVSMRKSRKNDVHSSSLGLVLIENLKYLNMIREDLNFDIYYFYYNMLSILITDKIKITGSSFVEVVDTEVHNILAVSVLNSTECNNASEIVRVSAFELVCVLQKNGVCIILDKLRVYIKEYDSNVEHIDCLLQALSNVCCRRIEHINIQIVFARGIALIFDVLECDINSTNNIEYIVNILESLQEITTVTRKRYIRFILNIIENKTHIENAGIQRKIYNFIREFIRHDSGFFAFLEVSGMNTIITCLESLRIIHQDTTTIILHFLLIACTTRRFLSQFMIGDGLVEILLDIIHDKKVHMKNIIQSYSIISQLSIISSFHTHVSEKMLISRFSSIILKGDNESVLFVYKILLSLFKSPNNYLYKDTTAIVDYSKEYLHGRRVKRRIRDYIFILVFGLFCTKFGARMHDYICRTGFSEYILCFIEVPYIKHKFSVYLSKLVPEICNDNVNTTRIVSFGFFEKTLSTLKEACLCKMEWYKMQSCVAMLCSVMDRNVEIRYSFVRRGGLVALHEILKKFPSIHSANLVLSILYSTVNTKNAHVYNHFQVQSNNIYQVLLGTSRRKHNKSLLTRLDTLAISQIVSKVLQYDIIDDILKVFSVYDIMLVSNLYQSSIARTLNSEKNLFPLLIDLFVEINRNITAKREFDLLLVTDEFAELRYYYNNRHLDCC